jgi:hypothetical protein
MAALQSEAMAQQPDIAILPPRVTHPAALYRFPEQAPCAFCRGPADRTVHADLNWPLLDIVRVTDAAVPNLPSCARCHAAYTRVDNLFVSIPRLFGYPLSTMYRLWTVPRLRHWVHRHAMIEPAPGPASMAWRDAVLLRFQWVAFYAALWGFTGLAAMGAYPAAPPLRHWSYLIFLTMAAGGALAFVSAAVQWLRYRLKRL